VTSPPPVEPHEAVGGARTSGVAVRTARAAVGLTLVLILAHATVDALSGTLAALLPTLKVRFGLSETALAALVATLSFSSSVTQPLFGGIADALGRRRVAAFGVILCAALLSLIAVAPSVWMLFALLLLGGLGSAAFHPAGTGIARSLGGARKGLVMAIFSGGGTLGFAMGPVIIGALLMSGRLDASPYLMIPGLLGGLAIMALIPQQERPPRTQRTKLLDFGLLRGPVGVLAAAGILRSIAFTTFVNAMPLWLVLHRGLATDDRVIFVSLALFSASAAVGGIVAGSLERRVRRQTLVTTTILVALVPLFALFVLTPGSLPYFLAVALAGALVNAGLPLMVVAAQDLAPHAVGSASGFMMGFTWGTAGVFYIVIGALQELVGIDVAMGLAFLMLVPSAALTHRVVRE
jgi:MFS transporter, FSR family, fosmidomycin resistance protein